MKKKSDSQSSTSSQHKSSEFQLNESFRQIPIQSKHNYITPKKDQQPRIFVQTPQAVFIPLTAKHSDTINQFGKSQDSIIYQNKPKKVSIFNEDFTQSTKLNRQVSSLSAFIIEKNKQHSSNVIKSKASIRFKKQRISMFFFYQNFIVCKGLRKVIVYNFFNKSIVHIPVKYDEFVLTQYPPYVFNCITGQYLNLYSETSVEKYAEIQRKKQLTNNNKQKIFQNYKQQNSVKSQDWKPENDKQIMTGGIQVIVVKISKLQVECICKYGQVIYMGGYNRSILPGGKRSERRQVYLMQNLDPKLNNKPKQIIKIQSSSFPVSQIRVQMPYLIIYCRPTFYVFALKSHQLLLTFQKQFRTSLLLQGRYALNVINGIGISTRNMKPTIFTYDVQNSPIFGVQITEHKQQATCLCLQKTGRIFGCHKSALFEYIPTKRITRCVKLYSQSDTILWIESTPNNNLLVLRQSQKLQYFIEAFSIDEGSINDY